jgi:hypothetical protein
MALKRHEIITFRVFVDDVERRPFRPKQSVFTKKSGFLGFAKFPLDRPDQMDHADDLSRNALGLGRSVGAEAGPEVFGLSDVEDFAERALEAINPRSRGNFGEELATEPLSQGILIAK